MRILAAMATSIALIPIGIYFGLLAALTIIQQTLATFIDFGNASWTSWMSPPVLLGLQSPGGSGGIIDALVGGPGSPGGTVGRLIVFAISGVIAYGCWLGLLNIWQWAQQAVKGVA